MKGNLVPSYRWLYRITKIGELLSIIENSFSRLGRVLDKLRSLGRVYDSVMFKVLDSLGKHAIGRELSDEEKAKFMLFLHEVMLIFIAVGYLIGYLVGR